MKTSRPIKYINATWGGECCFFSCANFVVVNSLFIVAVEVLCCFSCSFKLCPFIFGNLNAYCVMDCMDLLDICLCF